VAARSGVSNVLREMEMHAVALETHVHGEPGLELVAPLLLEAEKSDVELERLIDIEHAQNGREVGLEHATMIPMRESRRTCYSRPARARR
jgi:hypothetical protein